MKIMHILPSLTSGGVEQVVLEQCEGLIKAGHDSVVVSGGGAMVEDIERTGARHFTLEVGKKGLRIPFVIRKLAQLINEEEPDVLNLHSRLPAWYAHLAVKKLPMGKRPKIVATFHSYYSVTPYSAIMTKG
ncbi:MAG: glycosyltransferase, partial [Akkermansia sp.]|nr:glycosyltransferase [Akkermansia sp.]